MKNLKLRVIVGFLIMNLPQILFSQHQFSEHEYQEKWCAEQAGQSEYYIPDTEGTGGTYCDCYTGDYAVEVDFAYHWQYAIGQSLYYATMLNCEPQILLILEDETDLKFLNRLLQVSDKYGISVETITPADM